MPRLIAALVVVGFVTTLAAQTAETQTAARAPRFQAILELDANGDSTLERDEIPETGLKAFQTLLKYGDSDRDGKLTTGELRALGAMLRQNAPLGVAQFKTMDKDEDGRLSRAEYSGPSALFDRADANGDGAITQDEAARFVAARGKTALAKTNAGLPAKGQAILKRDADGDGKLSREEFPGRPAQFQRIDVDNDGFLDRAELRARFQAAGKKARKTKAKTKAAATP